MKQGQLELAIQITSKIEKKSEYLDKYALHRSIPNIRQMFTIHSSYSGLRQKKCFQTDVLGQTFFRVVNASSHN